MTRTIASYLNRLRPSAERADTPLTEREFDERGFEDVRTRQHINSRMQTLTAAGRFETWPTASIDS